MRKSRAETAETRQRIVDVAAELFRANGIHATGLADVMAAAGLSHGGFYRHFGSKDHLVAEACETGLNNIVGKLENASHGHEGQEAFNAVVDAYMSASHRDGPARGCPLAGMASELARADDATRAAAVRGFEALVETLVTSDESGTKKTADRSRAVFALSAMIGALTMSRVIADPEASAALLETVRQQIESL